MRTLLPGDVVEIVSPGWGAGKEDLDRSIKFIESLGLKAKVPADIFAPDLLCSNTDSYRFSHLEDALTSSDSKAVWCFKGGYGTTRLLYDLTKMSKPRHEKLLIGFSDITALHIFLNQEWGWQTLHAPVLWQLVNDRISPESINTLKEVIFGQRRELTFENLDQLNIAANRQEVIKSQIIGGNLALVQAMIGTPWELHAKNKIILLEEVDERAYRVDRMATQIRQSGLLDQAKALLLGDFIDKDDQEKLDNTVQRFAEELPIPVLYFPYSGHGKTNEPIPFGSPAELEFGESITLRVKF